MVLDSGPVPNSDLLLLAIDSAEHLIHWAWKAGPPAAFVFFTSGPSITARGQP